MKKFIFLLILITLISTNLFGESSRKITQLSSEERLLLIYPITKIISQSTGASEGFKFCKINHKLIFYRILAKTFKRTNSSLVTQINIQISEDSCHSWETIYQFPKDIEIDIFPFNYPNTESVQFDYHSPSGYSLQVVSENKIIFMGKDTSNFIIALMKNNNKWMKINEQRFPSYVDMIQLLKINDKESLCLIQNENDNSYQILKSNDDWANYFNVFTSKYSTDYNNPNMLPELKLLRINQNKVNDDVICFVHKFKNMLYITDKDFQNFQRIDFINNNEIINLRVLNDSIIYVLSYDRYYSKSYMLYKTTNKGKKWDIIYSDSSKYLKLYNFIVYDENHYAFLGYPFYGKNDILYKMKYTTDNGKNWQYAFEQNDPLFLTSDGSFYYDSLMSSFANLTINTKKFIDYPSFPFIYLNNIAISGTNQLNFICPFIDYLDSLNIFLVTLTYPFGSDTNLYPKEFTLNNNYTFREPFGSSPDTTYELSLYKDILMKNIQYYLILHTKEEEPQPMKLTLINGNKFLPFDDTLRWESIENTEKYDIKIYKLSPFNLFLEKIIIDTTVKDSFLVMPPLPEGHLYTILARSKNNTDSSRYFPFFVGESISPLSLAKINITNQIMMGSNYLRGINNIDFPDTVVNSNLTISWDKVASADYYKLFIFKIYINDFKGGVLTTTPIVMEENYINTSYLFNKFEENYIYEIVLWAESDFRRSPIFQAFYIYIKSNSTGKDELVSSFLFPNPARTTTRISLQREGNITISAIDVLGRSFPLWLGYASAGDMEIDVSKLPTGSYTLLIDYGTKREAVRMIKE
jgi:hypothetical protein